MRLPEYDDDFVKQNKKRYNLSKEYVEPFFNNFIDNYKHYFIRIIDEAIEADEKAYPFYSTMSIPISYQIVETILPRMFNRMMNFNIKTDMKNDVNDELAMKELIKYQINHPYLIDDPIFARLVSGLKECFITGNAWGEVPWYKKEVEVEEWQPYSVQLGINYPSWDNMEKILFYGVEPDWKIVKVKRNVIDAPVYNHRSIFHVFPDTKKKSALELSHVIIEEFMTQDEIIDMINISPESYKNVDVFKKMKAQKEYGSTSESTNYDDEVAQIFGSSDYRTKDKEEGQFKVWFVKEPDKYGIIINEKLTIRETGNPNGDGKLGLFLMKDIPIPGQLYAWGEPDPIKKIEDHMSDQANMKSDSVFYDLMRIWKLDPTALIEGEEFTPEPGRVVQMNDLNGLAPVDPGSTKASAFREYQEWDQIIQNTSGVTDYTTGQSAPGMNKTAGGVENLQAAANARFSLKLQLFENLGLKAMGTMYVQRNMRFFDEAQYVNEGKIVITPSAIRRLKGQVNFIVDAGSTEAAAKNQRLQKWNTIITAQGKIPFENPSEKAKDLMRKGMLYDLGEDDVDELSEQAAPPPAPPTTVPPPVLSSETPPAVSDKGNGGGVPHETRLLITKPVLNANTTTPPVGQAT